MPEIIQIANAPEERATVSTVSPGDLPWATVLMPTTSSGHSGIGESRHGLKTDSWVVGFFADGDSCQMPIVVGVLPYGPGQGSRVNSPVSALGGSIAAASPISPLVGNNNTLKAFDFFIKRNFTPEQAAGIIGCLLKESNMNPAAQNNAGGGRGAYGIAQWRGARQENLDKFALVNNAGRDNLQLQLEYIVNELNKSESLAYNLLQKTGNPTDACIAFAHFERGEDYSGAAYRNTGNGCPVDAITSNRFGTKRNILLDRIKYANQTYETAMRTPNG